MACSRASSVGARGGGGGPPVGLKLRRKVVDNEPIIISLAQIKRHQSYVQYVKL